MANRSLQTEAIVLGLSVFGEGHKIARLFLRDVDGDALINAAFFGGAKSRMRGLIVPYHSGTVWLYSNPQKEQYKITDFVVSDYRSGIRECVTRSWCAAVAAELVLRLHGTPDWNVVNAFLHGIAECSPAEARTALLRFLWRILSGAGLAPHIQSCVRCGEPFSRDVRCAYLSREDGCVCANCYSTHEHHFVLSPEATHFLYALENLAPSQSRAINLSQHAYNELKALLFFLTTSMVGSKLKSLESGLGIL